MNSSSKQKPKRSKSTTRKLPISLQADPQRSCTGRKSHNNELSLSCKGCKSPMPRKQYLAKYDTIFDRKESTRTKRLQTLQPRQKGREDTFYTTMNNTRLIFQEKDREICQLKEVDKQILMKKEELMRLEKKIKAQEDSLKLSELKVRSFEGVYTTKMNEILKGRKQIETMAMKVEQKMLAAQFESQKLQQRSKALQKQRSQLSLIRQQLNLREQGLKKFQSQLQSTIAQLQSRSLTLKHQQQTIQRVKAQQFAKDVELKSRQSHVITYVRELNSCIGSLRHERDNFSTIAVDLQHKCEQLQGIEIKIWKQLMRYTKQQGDSGGKNSKRLIVIDSFRNPEAQCEEQLYNS